MFVAGYKTTESWETHVISLFLIKVFIQQQRLQLVSLSKPCPQASSDSQIKSCQQMDKENVLFSGVGD